MRLQSLALLVLAGIALTLLHHAAPQPAGEAHAKVLGSTPPGRSAPPAASANPLRGRAGGVFFFHTFAARQWSGPCQTFQGIVRRNPRKQAGFVLAPVLPLWRA